jgi:GntR family transcriptional regulator, transcriptional repressor for pyruvate dehydrogenase complex
MRKSDSVEITKIASRKIYEQIASQIKDQIVNGKLLPGDKLPSTRELSESFQVGRSTVREALSALKAMGLVEIHQGEGSYVRKIDPSDLAMPQLDALIMSRTTILELLEARKSLEVSNAALAAEKRTEEDLRAFEQILERMKNSLDNEAEGEKEDILFHLTLAGATHNSIMMRLLETISGQMELAIRETRRLQVYSNKSVLIQLYKEHQEIYEAIQASNPEEAQNKMRQHLFHVERMLMPFLK